ncbi:MAG TPA: zf-HC2 domain-containing protein [Candidatus Aquilonibacter sp.]|nr:zf-HC2 domain-containing protein [Candidatus Aquilonibacter sp.]
MIEKHATTEDLIDYLHGELPPEADAGILAHLEQCAQCTALYDDQARLSESLRSYARSSERDLPQGVVASIWDAIEREERAPSSLQRLAAFLRPAYALPIAAVLVLGAFFGYTATHRAAATTTIDAAIYLRDHASLNSTMPFGDGASEPATLRSDESASDQQWIASTGTSVVAQDQ